MRGLVDVKWSKIQEKYIHNEKLKKNYNIVRWNKRLTEILIIHSMACYKERCEIITAESKSAHEQHIRIKAKELHANIKKNKWKINHDTLHMLDRSEFFFDNGNIINLQEWTKT